MSQGIIEDETGAIFRNCMFGTDGQLHESSLILFLFIKQIRWQSSGSLWEENYDTLLVCPALIELVCLHKVAYVKKRQTYHYLHVSVQLKFQLEAWSAPQKICVSTSFSLQLSFWNYEEFLKVGSVRL